MTRISIAGDPWVAPHTTFRLAVTGCGGWRLPLRMKKFTLLLSALFAFGSVTLLAEDTTPAAPTVSVQAPTNPPPAATAKAKKAHGKKEKKKHGKKKGSTPPAGNPSTGTTPAPAS